MDKKPKLKTHGKQPVQMLLNEKQLAVWRRIRGYCRERDVKIRVWVIRVLDRAMKEGWE